MRYSFLVIFFLLGCSSNTDRLDQVNSTKALPAKEETCDALAKNHLENLKFPFRKLDSLNATEIDPQRYLKFTVCDNMLFNNIRKDVQTYSYISLLESDEIYSAVLVYRQMDMENCVFVFTIDKNNNVIDSELLFCADGGPDRRTDVLMDGKIVTDLYQEKKAIFTSKKCISSYKEFYSIVDTVANSKVTEVGLQKIIEYQIEKTGQIKNVNQNSFTKEYAKTKYWYN